MRFSASPILGALSVAHLAAAAPISTFQYSSLISFQSGYTLHTASLSASSSNLYTNLRSQNASCERGNDPDVATLAIDLDRVLHLHTGSAPAQRFYVDRSGMGQGKLGYTTGDQPSPQNAGRGGWDVVDGFLYFDGAGLIACPSGIIDGAWTIWVSAGVQNPGGNIGCTPCAARVGYLAEGGPAGVGPSPCAYTQ